MNIKTSAAIFIACLLISAGCSSQKNTTTKMSEENTFDTMNYKSRTITGSLSGKTIHLPEVDVSSTRSIEAHRFILDGQPISNFPLDTSKHMPDARSFNRKFG